MAAAPPEQPTPDRPTPDRPTPDEPTSERGDGTTGPPPDTSDEETSRLMHDLAVANDCGPDPDSTGTRDGGA